MNEQNLITTPTAATLRDKLETATTELADLRAQLGTLVLAAVSGGEEATTTLQAHKQSIAEAEQRVTDLEAALRALEKQEAEALARQRHSLLAMRVRAAKRVLRKELEPALAQIASGVAQAVAGWQAAIEAQRNVTTATPQECKKAIMGICNPLGLRKLVVDEIGRLDGVMFTGEACHGQQDYLFPGGPGFCNPASFQPMEEGARGKIKAACDAIDRAVREADATGGAVSEEAA